KPGSRGRDAMPDENALDDLVRCACDPAGSAESVREAVSTALATVPVAERPRAERFVKRLAADVIDAPTRPDLAANVAILCGAFAERGLDPTIALGAILDRLERDILPEAVAFLHACQQA